jgi:predicted amidohydrolase
LSRGWIAVAKSVTVSEHSLSVAGTATMPRSWLVKAGDMPRAVSVNGQTMGIAICADAAKATHPQKYAEAGANIYAAGVFLTAEWYATDAPRLAGYAIPYRMLILMANHAASVGTYTSVGKSAVWAPDGSLLAQAEGMENALVIATNNDAEWHGEVIRI